MTNVYGVITPSFRRWCVRICAVIVQDDGEYGLSAACVLYRLRSKEQAFVFHCLRIICTILRCGRGFRGGADVFEEEYDAIYGAIVMIYQFAMQDVRDKSCL